MSAVTDNNHRSWPFLALKSAPASPSRLHCDNFNGDPLLAKLEWKELEYWMRRKRITIGRNSSKGDVDIDMGHSSFVSRVHLEITFENSIFYLRCNGKNGIFVDGVFQRMGASPFKLPKQCVLRFPSTSLCVMFTSMLVNDSVGCLQLVPESPTDVVVDDRRRDGSASGLDSTVTALPPPLPALEPEDDRAIDQPLVISIPGPASSSSSTPPHHTAPSVTSRVEQTMMNGQDGGNGLVSAMRSAHKFHYSDSPLPSPTGTISAANSCPTSPGGMHLALPLRRQQLMAKHVKPATAGHQKLLRATGGMHVVTPVADSRAEEITLHYERDDGHGSCSQRVLLLNSNGSDTATAPSPSSSSLPPSNGTSTTSRGSSGKPPFSYAQLIIQAITSAPDRQLTLSGIYAFITRHYPYYRTADKGWQNSIRHNLSLNRYFVKVARGHEQPGKGSFWRLETTSEGRLAEQAYRRRRQRATASVGAAVIGSTAAISSTSTAAAAAAAGVGVVSLDDCVDMAEPDHDTSVSYSSQSAPVSPSQSRYAAFDHYELDAGTGDRVSRAPRVLLRPGSDVSPVGAVSTRLTCMSAPGSPRHHFSNSHPPSHGYSVASASNGDIGGSGSHLMSALQGKSARSLSSLTASEGTAILAMESLQTSVTKPAADTNGDQLDSEQTNHPGSAAELLLAAAAAAHKRQLADEQQNGGVGVAELLVDCGDDTVKTSDCKRVCVYGALE